MNVKDISYKTDLFENAKVDPKRNETLINKINDSSGDEKQKYIWELVEANYRLVYNVVTKKFGNCNRSIECLISDGMYALYVACSKTKRDTVNNVFVSYASKTIYFRILKNLVKRHGVVDYPHGKSVDITENECSIDVLNYKDCLSSDTKSFENVLKDSDGEFCEKVFGDCIETYNKKRKENGIRGIAFFTKKTLDLLGVLDLDLTNQERCERANLTKQRIEKLRYDTFTYFVQYIRDADSEDRKEFFNIIFNGKYNLENPPPFSGWRKRIWDGVMSEETGTFKSSNYYITKKDK